MWGIFVTISSYFDTISISIDGSSDLSIFYLLFFCLPETYIEKKNSFKALLAMPYNNYRQYIAVSILENDLHVQVDCVQGDRLCS